MQNNTKQTRYYSGQGIVLVAELDSNNVPQGFRNIGNVPDLKLAIEVEVEEKKESSTGQRATVLRLEKEKKASFSATLEDLSKETLAMALRGSAASVTSGSVEDEAIVACLGYTVPLEHPGVSNVVVTDATGVTTYELDKNYTINAEAGSINILTDAAQTAAGAAANIADAAALLVDYDHVAYEQVDALTAANKYYALRFEGLNTADSNKAVIVEIFRISADPLKELALINDETAAMTLDGSIMADLTRTVGSQFFREKIVS